MKMNVFRGKLKIAAMALMFGVAGCASQVLESYVGKSVTEAMLDNGVPTAVFDLPDGTRAFQWKLDSSGVIPITSPTTTDFYGSGGWATATTTTTSYMPYSQTCNYTLLAKLSGEDWIVVGFRKPTLMCE